MQRDLERIKDQEVKKSFTVGSTLRSLLFKVTIFCELVVWRILRVIKFYTFAACAGGVALSDHR